MRGILLAQWLVFHYGCGGGASSAPVNSSNPIAATPGRFIVFSSDRPGGAGGSDVFLYDRETQSSSALPGLNTSLFEIVRGISDDGRFIGFSQGQIGIFGSPPEQARLYDRQSQRLVDLPGLNSPNEIHGAPAIVGDGRFLVFTSTRVGDTTLDRDIKLYDRQTQTLLSLPGLNTSSVEWQDSISGDGRFITFASNRPGGAGLDDIYLYDRQTQSLVSLPGLNTSSNEGTPAISRDGRLIAFNSDRPGGRGQSDIYLYDRQTSSLVTLPNLNTAADEGNASFSSDGRFIVFNRLDSDGHLHIHLYDRQPQAEVPVPSLNSPGSEDLAPRIS